MLELVFASNNKNKYKELINIIREIGLDEEVSLVSLSELCINIDIEENMPTLEENAIKKAKEVYQILRSEGIKKAVIAEDFGFFIEAFPKIAGIHSNRWFKGSDEDRNKEVLKKMKNEENRRCFYKSVFAVYDGDIERVFGGHTYGNVATEIRGQNGFAYDSIFEIQDGRTIAELQPEEKDEISSRREAFEYLVKALVEV